MVVILLVGGEPCAPSPIPSTSTTVSIISSGSQVSPEDSLSVTKEEEWVKRKKVEVVTKRQIATRVQREVVLEDGKVVQDSGPKVTTTTTEDTEKQESENTEHRDIDGGKEGEAAVLSLVDAAIEPGILKQVREKKVTTRQVKSETTETEDVRHLGDITDEAYRRAVETGGDLENSLIERSRWRGDLALRDQGPRVVGHTKKTTTVTDSEATLKKTGVGPDGVLFTDTSTTKEHEEVNEEEEPRGDKPLEDKVTEEREHHAHTRDQEFLDYLVDGVRVGTEMRYQAETREGGLGWDPDRRDAFTRRPLDPDQEERTRKVETSKWLENHFGSERRSPTTVTTTSPSEGFISVTMRSSSGGGVPPPPTAANFHGVSEWAHRPVQVLPTGPGLTFSPPSPADRSSPPMSPPLSPPPRNRHRQQQQVVREEPSPDYSPEPQHRATPTKDSDSKKKVYQRTRFAMDIPVNGQGKRAGSSNGDHYNHHQGQTPPPPPPAAAAPTKAKRSLGESFRRLVGKLGGGGNKQRHNNKRVGVGPQHQGGGTSPAPGAAPPTAVDSGTQTGEVNRFYLGENPYHGSIYGRESEYNRESSTLGRLSKSTGKLSDREKPTPNGISSYYYTDRGGVQTLPRRLEENKKQQVHVTRSAGYQGSRSSPQSDRFKKLGNNSSSMFNVSIVNNPSGSYLNGPTKPARTYQSNLLRSKSFNVHGGGDPYRYTSSPSLHRIDGSHAPLKSPAIVTTISRSTRDLTSDFSDSDRKPLSTYNQNKYRNGYNSRSTVDTKKKIFMKGLMERAPELYRTLHENERNDRNTDRYRNGKTEYSSSYRSSNTSSPLERVHSPVGSYFSSNGADVDRSIVRRGSNDFTETFSYKTKNDDPMNPSETNTVKSFTKKTIPSMNGRRETIERSETKTITKSKFRSGTPELKYLENGNKYSSNGGVVIEVRNTRK